ncbi:alpha/beta hydrolase [Rubritalea tangerina]|uniref:Alpha/beta hydrolase n=1 Tax=Rubritalea tangerina TaxID=430798 RepID=A0ABW4Z7T2_9BACT
MFFRLLTLTTLLSSLTLATPAVIDLWPHSVPGQNTPKQAPEVSPNKAGNVTRLSKVTTPTLTVYHPTPETNNHTAIIVCPGGGYNILAIDKEGYEIGQWLSKHGYTACVLQYRVPRNQDGALQDAQRAIRLARSKSQQWSTNKVGVLGFSAGGSLSARVSALHPTPLYPPIDVIDNHTPRPDFAILIYPAFLDQGPQQSLSPDIQIDPNFPPSFLFVTGDDRFANSSLVMAKSLQSKKRPYQLHIYPKGGHGYGIRPGNPAAETWPNLCIKWLNKNVLTQPLSKK